MRLMGNANSQICPALLGLSLLIAATAVEAQESPYSKPKSVPTASQMPRQSASRRMANPVVTSPPVIVTGEVVDAWCYASGTMGPGRGPAHKACALACIAGGVTPGIAEDGTGLLWIAAKYKGYQGCKEILMPLVARHVKVTGWAAHIGTCNLLKIKSIQILDGPDTGKVVPEPPKPPRSSTTSTQGH